MKTTLKSFLVASAVAIAFTQGAAAASVTNQMQVKLHVNASCDFNTKAIADIEFANSAVNTQNVKQTGEFRVQCTKGTAPIVKMSSAKNWSMVGLDATNLNASVGYKLYQDAAHAQVWNQEHGQAVSADGQENVFTVYAKVDNVGDTAGDFGDTVTVSLDF